MLYLPFYETEERVSIVMFCDALGGGLFSVLTVTLQKSP